MLVGVVKLDMELVDRELEEIVVGVDALVDELLIEDDVRVEVEVGEVLGVEEVAWVDALVEE